MVSSPPVGWADSTQPYLKSVQIFQCPSESTAPGTDPTQAGYTDYWYNSNLSSPSETAGDSNVAVGIASLANAPLTIMVGDGDAVNGAASYRCNGNFSAGGAVYNNVSRPAPSTATGFAGSGAIVTRHLEGINFLFADGHVKWCKTTGSTDSTSAKGVIYRAPTPFSVSANAPTFRVRA